MVAPMRTAAADAGRYRSLLAELSAGRYRSLLAALRRRMRTHVVTGVGLSNTVLNRLAKLACDENFRGVYSSDRLPTHLTIRPYFIIIVNLATSNTPEGHFVTIAADRKKVYYLDSFAMGVYVKSVADFLAACNRPVVENLNRIQSFKSVNCGAYALLFAVYFNRKAQAKSQPERMPRFRLRFHFGHKRDLPLRQNDASCFSYLQRLSV